MNQIFIIKLFILFFSIILISFESYAFSFVSRTPTDTWYFTINFNGSDISQCKKIKGTKKTNKMNESKLFSTVLPNSTCDRGDYPPFGLSQNITHVVCLDSQKQIKNFISTYSKDECQLQKKLVSNWSYEDTNENVLGFKTFEKNLNIEKDCYPRKPGPQTKCNGPGMYKYKSTEYYIRERHYCALEKCKGILLKVKAKMNDEDRRSYEAIKKILKAKTKNKVHETSWRLNDLSSYIVYSKMKNGFLFSSAIIPNKGTKKNELLFSKIGFTNPMPFHLANMETVLKEKIIPKIKALKNTKKKKESDLEI